MLGLLTGLLVLGGTVWDADATPPGSKDPCHDPYPCESAWPEGLTGPFALKEVRRTQVRSHDGTMLDGWIASPTVPAGVRTPVVLLSSGYFDYTGTNGVSGNPSDDDLPTCDSVTVFCGSWRDDEKAFGTDLAGVPPIRLIRRGYTLAFFSVRGTGSSGGCYEYGGRNEQRDQLVLIDWLAKQSWSNGRVGMGGLSWPSGTTWQAAVQAPPALKAIVTAGDQVEAFTLNHSPQGAYSVNDFAGASGQDAGIGLVTGARSGMPFVQRKTCPQAQVAAKAVGELDAGERDEAYWTERSLLRRLPSVRAAVLNTTGYLDIPQHQFQGDAIWGSLAPGTPKVQVRGWWAHDYPRPGNTVKTKLDFPSGTVTWEHVVTRWFDYWLKGIGPEPKAPRVYHQDQTLKWHESLTWSARPQSKQVLYLTDTQLTAHPRGGSTTFLSAPALDVSLGEKVQSVEADDSGVETALCPDPATAALSRRYDSTPVTSRTLIAGNPMAYLRLSSDQPGGLVSASLFDISPDFSCAGPHHTGAQWMSWGTADLTFHNSPFTPHAFPVATPRQVRIDLTDLTYTLAPGHRLALVLHFGEVWQRGGVRYYPQLTVHGGGVDASQLVVPVAEGTLGGSRPTLRYPARPMTPPRYRD